MNKLLAVLMFVAMLGANSAVAAENAASKKAPKQVTTSLCPCSGTKLCVGPRGGRYCVTAAGKKRYHRR